MINTNFHTHTYLCKHANGNIEDFVKKAIEKHYLTLGISDHGPMNDELYKRLNTRRMNFDEYYNVYLKEYDIVKAKYKDQINLHIGVEIEYLNENIQDYTIFKENLDYLLLGVHYFDYKDKIYTTYSIGQNKELMHAYKDNVIKALNTKMFSILAHPDLFLWGYNTFDEDVKNISKEIISCAIYNNVLLEINANGIRNCLLKHKYIEKEDGTKLYSYPNYNFFKLAKEMNAKVIINDDAHDPSHIHDKCTEEAYLLAKDLNFDPVQSIDLKRWNNN